MAACGGVKGWGRVWGRRRWEGRPAVTAPHRDGHSFPVCSWRSAVSPSCVCVFVTQSCLTLCHSPGPWPARFLCPWKFLRQEFGHCLFALFLCFVGALTAGFSERIWAPPWVVSSCLQLAVTIYANPSFYKLSTNWYETIVFLVVHLACAHYKRKGKCRKKNGAGEIRYPDFRLYYKATLLKILYYWHKGRNIGQWNRLESPEINPHTFGQLIHNQRGNNVQWGKSQSLQ